MPIDIRLHPPEASRRRIWSADGAIALADDRRGLPSEVYLAYLCGYSNAAGRRTWLLIATDEPQSMADDREIVWCLADAVRALVDR